MATQQGYIEDINGNKRLPENTSTLVTDLARSRALSASLAELIEYYVLGVQKFSTITSYAVGDKVFYDRGLWRFTIAHPAGAWTGEDVERTTISGEDEGLREDVETISAVIAEALCSLKAENDGLKAMLNDPTRRINAEEYYSMGYPMMLSAAGAPNASVVPNEWNTETMGVWTGVPMVPGQEYFDTTNSKWYKAKMILNGATADWLLMN